MMLRHLDLRPIPFSEQNEVIEVAKTRDFWNGRVEALKSVIEIRKLGKTPTTETLEKAGVQLLVTLHELRNLLISAVQFLRDAEAAKLRLFGAVFKYAWKQANKHARWRDSMEPDDLITISWDAVDHAIRKFDPARGVKFLTYAGWWILQYQVRHVQGDGIVRQPAYRYSGDLMEQALQMDQIVSLDAQTNGMTNEAFVFRHNMTTSIEDDDRPQYSWDRTQIQRMVSATAFLSARERFAFLAVDSGDLTLKEAADLLGVTRDKIRQLKGEAREKVAERMKRKLMRLVWVPEQPGICVQRGCGQLTRGGGALRCREHFNDLIQEARYERHTITEW